MRKLWVVLLLLALIWAATMLVQGFSRGEHVRKSAVGVLLSLGEDIAPLEVGDLGQPQLEELLDRVAGQMSQQPIQPMIDRVTKGVIPGLAGWELDVTATMAKVMLAEPGSLVQPILYPVEPESLWNYASHPIYQGNPAKQQIALVINVAWGNEYLPEMLAILQQADVKASFFLVGRWAANNPDLIRQIAAAGHEFGNHAYSDPHLPQLSRDKIAGEITRTSEVITAVTGQEVKYFSPPYNDFNQTVLDTAAELGYLTVLCSLDTADWMRPGVDRIVQRIVPRAHNGAIVLMHPTEQTPAALARIVRGLLDQGYQLVTISQLLSPIAADYQIVNAE
ncbi:MAG: polysaccharide deacetylase family protein [Bacillota bacterium]|jgi:probable sporulation protein (polysaccharide deacetylase family)